MPFDAKTLSQPWVKYSLFAVAGIGVIYIATKNSSSAIVVSNQGIDPNIAQLQGQQNTLAAQIVEQNSKQSFALEAQKLTNDAALQSQQNQIIGNQNIELIKSDATRLIAQDNELTQIQIAQINQQNAQNQQSTALTIADNAALSARTVEIIRANNQAKINADNNAAAISLASGNSAVQKYLSDNQTRAITNQTDKTASTANHASDNSLLGNIASLVSAFF